MTTMVASRLTLLLLILCSTTITRAEEETQDHVVVLHASNFTQLTEGKDFLLELYVLSHTRSS